MIRDSIVRVALLIVAGTFAGLAAQAPLTPEATATASVNVRVTGARPDLPVTVFIEPSRSGGHDVLAYVGKEAALTKWDLHFGTYYVSATQGDDLVTAIASVVLDAAHPTATVDLEISENRSTLVLAGSDLNPAKRATVRPLRAGGPPFLRRTGDLTEVQPGVYPLDGLRPGTPLIIHAEGFVPICRVVPRNETDFVVLERGRRVEVQFPRDITPAVAAELASLDNVPGSNCPVPLSSFEPQAMNSGAQGLIFRIEHFHPSFRFLLKRPGLTRQIVVPDHGSVSVEDQ